MINIILIISLCFASSILIPAPTPAFSAKDIKQLKNELIWTSLTSKQTKNITYEYNKEIGLCAIHSILTVMWLYLALKNKKYPDRYISNSIDCVLNTTMACLSAYQALQSYFKIKEVNKECQNLKNEKKK